MSTYYIGSTVDKPGKAEEVAWNPRIIFSESEIQARWSGPIALRIYAYLAVAFNPVDTRLLSQRKQKGERKMDS